MPTPAPNDLIRLQRLFHGAISPGGDPACLEALEPQLHGSGNLSVRQGIAAYKGSVKGKLIRCLEEIYPVCRRLVGAAFFGGLAETYVMQNASTSPDLGDYGGDLPVFLQTFPPAKALPYLADVAQLEWHWHRAFNAADESGIDLTALAQVAPGQWERLVFQLPQSSVLMQSDFPVHRIWQANQADATDSETIDLDEGSVNLFIWRDGVETRIDRPNPDEWRLLEGFAARTEFGQLCSELDQGAVPVDPAVLLPVFVQRGWVRSFVLDSTMLQAASRLT
ncbi:DNA-binding domain-containing protein [Synechococcus sp. CS-603]|uniref:HvfC/BufC N-terminal domain-containing protein n=1 Tax=Synechococcus sp. CS-603 TaxID=2847981 RepID=UPI00223B21E4|nr:DNA-binding domain-containing protein [Synechococcus sp. CS-603]MCT0201472.1 putative DNA-binding domain-containing protein [Synechococcus sp. CS-603]